MQIRLYESKGATRISIDACLTESGDVQIAGYDIGEAPKQWWSHDDYEYTVTVRKENKDRLLLALLEAIYGGDAQAVSRFRDFVQEKNIRVCQVICVNDLLLG
jgi:hypothetical protein